MVDGQKSTKYKCCHGCGATIVGLALQIADGWGVKKHHIIALCWCYNSYL